MVSLAYLQEALHYNPETGIIYWRHDRPRTHFKTDRAWKGFLTRDAGNVAGTLSGGGYVLIGVGGKVLLGHRIAYALHHGIELADLPSRIDHEDRDCANNSANNLRPATHNQNMHNRCLNSDNTSGLKGVSWHVRVERWAANIRINTKKKHLGYFDTPEAAHAAYVKAANENFGEYARAV